MNESKFDVTEAQKFLRTKWFGRELIYSETTGTTMDDAEQGAKLQGLPHGTAFLADRQTNARGSKGRVWDARDSGNLYVSFIVFRDKDRDEEVPDRSKEYDIDVAASLASFLTLRDMGVKGISIKWLNDLWIRGHKIQGALAEYKGTLTVDSSQKHLYILGIGLNINSDMRRRIPMNSVATSVMCELQRAVSRERLFAEIANRLEEILAMDPCQLQQMMVENQTFSVGSEVKLYYTDLEKPPAVCRFQGVRDDWSIKLADLQDSGSEWTVAISDASMRPHPKRSVYVYKGQSSQGWSCTLLWRTMEALVDTSIYEIKFLTDGHLDKGVPADCALVVVGELTTGDKQSSLIQVLQSYTRNGGASFCVGTAANIFFPPAATGLNGADSNSERILTHICTSTAGSESIALISVREDQTLPSIPSNTSQKPLGYHMSSESIALSVCNYGDGRLCVCGPNIEVTYADLEEFFPSQVSVMDQLKKTVFARDSLLCRVLEEMGL